ncbi:MAG TPA: RNA methyltransferase [Chitinophagaceae bacterium]|nr:RNA methyltransferase [Chitinophagaceae bacterium]MCC6634454.1 RNA methyltransferase [Chitinophagaceae bacterium]HNF29004.1 RNA methyltransferase [Chitinophagaceae bacterium]HNJ58422.1 RNA methyltransferase [Chitinophagaceae bacterium]HNL82406.1 RNA methyltransferase [Chitinophagaceae bacterium]
MLSKNDIKYIQSLCHKKQRGIEKLFIAEGPKILEELLNSSFEIEKIYATKDYLSKLDTYNNNIIEISEIEMNKVSQLSTPSTVIALVKQKPDYYSNLTNKLNLVLDGIQDPGNLGTIIRIADWYGVENIFCTNDTVDWYNNKVIQSTMGSFVRVNIWYGNVEEILTNHKLPVYGAVLNGNNLFENTDAKEGFLIIGNEGKGIRTNLLPVINYPVTIPKKGGAESLNAAVATGILLSWFTK